MSNTDAKSKPALGFLTVVEHPQYGLFGGYLVLNLAGRPLEFHCTAPIKPNRAQEILYGPTLESFLYGEQIGQTLFNKLASPPARLYRSRAGLGRPRVRRDAHRPGAAAEAKPRPAKCPIRGGQRTGRSPAAGRGPSSGPRLVTFELGRNRLALPERADEDRGLIDRRLAELADSFDLAEPFQRIRDAIEEAQQAVR